MSEWKTRSVKLASDILNVDSLRQSAELCEKILEKGDDLDTMALFSRVCWSMGNLVKEKREQKEWFAKGRD